MSKCVFTIDVEDWFHILDLPSTPDLSVWEFLPSRVEANFVRMLELLSEHDVKATCFFLGWVAQRFPHLVKSAQSLGHEIASHGYSHRLVYHMTPAEFLADAVRSKRVLEEVSDSPVIGFRAPGFSVTQEVPWFFDKVGEAGFRYDSSVFPMPRGHGGLAGAQYAPYRVTSSHGDLIEFPMTLTSVLNQAACLFGGGYLRLAPWKLIQWGAKKVLAEDRPVVFYLHPREIDPTHPRLAMGPVRRFKSYVNLSKTERKVSRILSEFQFTTFAGMLSEFTESRAAAREGKGVIVA